MSYHNDLGGGRAALVRAMHGVDGLTQRASCALVVRSLLLPEPAGESGGGGSPPTAAEEAAKEEDAAAAAAALGLDALLSCAACSTELPELANDVGGVTAWQRLEDVATRAPRAVCQYVFKRNDIVWICRTCQADETCVMCNACYRESNHAGHDVYFYHAQAGGCCDCGDPDAWDVAGFCTRHGERASDANVLALAPRNLVDSSRVVVDEIARAMLVACAASVGGYCAHSPNATATSASSASSIAGGGGGGGGGAMLSDYFEDDDEATRAARESSSELERCAATRPSRATCDDDGDDDDEAAAAAEAGPQQWRTLERIDTEFRWEDDEEQVALVMHNDDIHSFNEIMAPLQLMGLSTREARALALKAHECGEAMLRRGTRRRIRQLAAVLRARGVLISVRSAHAATWAARSRRAIAWLHRVAASSDALCRLVCGIFDTETLAALLRADARLPKATAVALHALYLALMADQPFKRAIATAYARVYEATTADYARGVGVADRSVYTLSVQYLNRATFVAGLVEREDLLRTIAFALLDVLDSAASEVEEEEEEERAGSRRPSEAAPSNTNHSTSAPPPLLRAGDEAADPGVAPLPARAPAAAASAASLARRRSAAAALEDVSDEDVTESFHDEMSHARYGERRYLRQNHADRRRGPRRVVSTGHPVLLHRRYSPIVADLKCVLNIDGMSERFVRDCLGAWLGALARVHGVDAQTRRTDREAHVVYESRDWMFAFNVNISVASVYDFLASWVRRAPAIDARRSRKKKKRPVGGSATAPPSAVDLVGRVCRETIRELRRLSPAAPSGVDDADALPTPLLALGGPGPTSFHAALHRFLAHVVQEAAKSQRLEPELAKLVDSLRATRPAWKLAQLVREPLKALAMAAQIRVGLWRRNGHTMNDQLMNYAEPPFCKMFRDLDVVAVQFIGLAFQDPGEVAALILTAIDPLGPLVSSDDDDDDGLSDKALNEARVAADERAPYAGALAEEALLLLAIFATELPRLPDPQDDEEEEGEEEEKKEEKADDQKGTGTPAAAGATTTNTGTTSPESATATSPPAHRHRHHHHHHHPHCGGVDGGAPGAARSRRIEALIRRELVHRLAAAPCTHSEVHECFLQLVPKSDAMPAAASDAILRKVATRLEPSANGLEPEKLRLKTECWTEFDATFFHLSAAAHQRALEAMPAALKQLRVSPEKNDNSPDGGEDDHCCCCPPPPEAHRLFAAFRVGLLSCDATLAAVHVTLEDAARDDLDDASPPPKPRWKHPLSSTSRASSSAPAASSWSSETSVSRALHLLALLAHSAPNEVLERSAKFDTTKAKKKKKKKKTNGAPPPPTTAAAAASSSSAEEKEAARKTTAPTIGYLVQALLHLTVNKEDARRDDMDRDFEHKYDASTVAILQWLDRKLAPFLPPFVPPARPAKKADLEDEGKARDEEAHDASSAPSPSSSPAKKKRSAANLEERKRRARERALASMKQKSRAFASTLEGGEDSVAPKESPAKNVRSPPKTATGVDDDDDDDDGAVAQPMDVVEADHGGNSLVRDYDSVVEPFANSPTTGGGGEAATPPRRESPTPQEGGQPGPSPHLSSAAACSDVACIVCREAPSATRLVGYIGFAQRSTVLRARGAGAADYEGVHVRQCGHALHYDCFDSYFAAVVHRSEAHGHVALDVDAGEFQCPLCKQLSNVLVPCDVDLLETGTGSVPSSSSSSSSSMVRRRSEMIAASRATSASSLDGLTSGLADYDAILSAMGDSAQPQASKAPAPQQQQQQQQQAAPAKRPSKRPSSGRIVLTAPDDLLMRPYEEASAEPADDFSLAAPEMAAHEGAPMHVDESLTMRRSAEAKLLKKKKADLDDVDELASWSMSGLDAALVDFANTIDHATSSSSSSSEPLSDAGAELAAARFVATIGDVARRRAPSSPLSLVGMAAAAAAAPAVVPPAGGTTAAASTSTDDLLGATAQVAAHLPPHAASGAAPTTGEGPPPPWEVTHASSAPLDGIIIVSRRLDNPLPPPRPPGSGPRKKNTGNDDDAEEEPSSPSRPPSQRPWAIIQIRFTSDKLRAEVADLDATAQSLSCCVATIAARYQGLESADARRELRRCARIARALRRAAGRATPRAAMRRLLRIVLDGASTVEMMTMATKNNTPGAKKTAAEGAPTTTRSSSAAAATPRRSPPRLDEYYEAAVTTPSSTSAYASSLSSSAAVNEAKGDGAPRDVEDEINVARPLLHAECGALLAALLATLSADSRRATVLMCVRMLALARAAQCVYHHASQRSGPVDDGGGGVGGGGDVVGGPDDGDAAAAPSSGARAAASTTPTVGGASASPSSSSADAAFLAAPREDVRELARLLQRSGAPAPCWSIGALRRVAEEVDAGLHHFLRLSALLLDAWGVAPCRRSSRDLGENEADQSKRRCASYMSPDYDEPLGAWMAQYGVPDLQEMVRSVSLASTVRRWADHAHAHSRAVLARDGGMRRSLVRAPAPRIALWDLPRAYTELHASIAGRVHVAASANLFDPDFGSAAPLTSHPTLEDDEDAMMRTHTNIINENNDNNNNNTNSGSATSDHPAVCLVCGTVLCADGKGACTRHAQRCGAGIGLVFLLQESSLLLIHGSRAAYFPSPYVDAHGERHGQFRGRPLFLDDRRLELVREKWATHAVADAVVQSRSTSRQVIINNFY